MATDSSPFSVPSYFFFPHFQSIWSSSFRDFGETFAVGLDISKAFDRVWHKSLISKLSSYRFYPYICTLISSFLSDRSIQSIAAVVDGHCSSPKPINSGVSQGSILSSTLFLLFINISDSAFYPIQCWWHHLAFFNVIQQTSNPTRVQGQLICSMPQKLNFYNYLLNR